MSGWSAITASWRVALQSENITQGRETASSLIFRTTESLMRPSFFPTYIIGLLEEKDKRTKFWRPASLSIFRDRSSEFIFAWREPSRSVAADIRPNSRIESRLAESVKWKRKTNILVPKHY